MRYLPKPPAVPYVSAGSHTEAHNHHHHIIRHQYIFFSIQARLSFFRKRRSNNIPVVIPVINVSFLKALSLHSTHTQVNSLSEINYGSSLGTLLCDSNSCSCSDFSKDYCKNDNVVSLVQKVICRETKSVVKNCRSIFCTLEAKALLRSWWTSEATWRWCFGNWHWCRTKLLWLSSGNVSYSSWLQSTCGETSRRKFGKSWRQSSNKDVYCSFIRGYELCQGKSRCGGQFCGCCCMYKVVVFPNWRTNSENCSRGEKSFNACEYSDCLILVPVRNKFWNRELTLERKFKCHK